MLHRWFLWMNQWMNRKAHDWWRRRFHFVYEFITNTKQSVLGDLRDADEAPKEFWNVLVKWREDFADRWRVWCVWGIRSRRRWRWVCGNEYHDKLSLKQTNNTSSTIGGGALWKRYIALRNGGGGLFGGRSRSSGLFFLGIENGGPVFLDLVGELLVFRRAALFHLYDGFPNTKLVIANQRFCDPNLHQKFQRTTNKRLGLFSLLHR